MTTSGRLPLTHRQAEVLAFIRDFIRDQGYPPTYREIMLAFGFSTPSAVTVHFRPLVRKGYLALDGVARGLRPLDDLETHAERVDRLRCEADAAVARWEAAVAEGTVAEAEAIRAMEDPPSEFPAAKISGGFP